MGLFDSLFGDQGMSQLRRGQRLANKNYKRGDEALLQGQDSGVSALNQATDKTVAAYQPLQATGNAALTDYYSLLQNPDSIYDSEIYKSREAAGIEELDRLAAGRGMLSSGNNTQDILDYMRQGGLEYFDMLTNKYSPLLNIAGQAAAGIGNAYQNQGANLSNVYTGTAANRANLYGQGANTASQFGQNMASAEAAQKAAPWDFILGLAKAGANAYGKA